MRVRRYHIYVTVALLIPVLIAFWLTLTVEPIWAKILVFLAGWVISLFIAIEVCWQTVIWWNKRKREKALKVSS